MKTNSVGFTLIELIVTMTIIAVLSIMAFSTYSSIQSKARDAKRKTDLKKIAVALEVYHQINHQYPASYGPSAPNCSDGPGNLWCLSTNTSNPWIPNLDDQYISGLPRDPLRDSATPMHANDNGYGYFSYQSGAGPVSCTQGDNQFYALVTTLENHTDPERNANQNVAWCDGTTHTFSGLGWSPDSYVIVSHDL